MSASSKPLAIALALALSACASGSTATETAPMPAPTAEAAPAAPAAATPTASADAGHFTATQANQGRDTFRSLCTECHYSGEFSDEQFKFKWSRRSAENLYDIIFTQMPESAPGSLTPEEAVGLVAYILRLNGFEAGSNELPADGEALAAISLRSIRGS